MLICKRGISKSTEKEEKGARAGTREEDFCEIKRRKINPTRKAPRGKVVQVIIQKRRQEGRRDARKGKLWGQRRRISTFGTRPRQTPQKGTRSVRNRSAKRPKKPLIPTDLHTTWSPKMTSVNKLNGTQEKRREKRENGRRYRQGGRCNPDEVNSEEPGEKR